MAAAAALLDSAVAAALVPVGLVPAVLVPAVLVPVVPLPVLPVPVPHEAALPALVPPVLLRVPGLRAPVLAQVPAEPVLLHLLPWPLPRVVVESEVPLHRRGRQSSSAAMARSSPPTEKPTYERAPSTR